MKLSEQRHIFLWMLNDLFNYIRPVIEQNQVVMYMKCLYRTPAEQKLHVKAGRSDTMYSQHLKGLALDIVLIKSNKFLTDSPIYGLMGYYWEGLGGRWGGRFKMKNGGTDPYHFEFSLKRWKEWKKENEETSAGMSDQI